MRPITAAWLSPMNLVTSIPVSAPSPRADSSPDRVGISDQGKRACAMAAALALALIWSYGTTLATMVERWSTDPQYSHGFLVPLFALTVLWFRRGGLEKVRWEPNPWGLALLTVGLAVRLFAIRMDIDPIDAASLLPVMCGLVLFVGGTGLLLWSWPALAFLAFMLPLPFTWEVALAHPLRRLATVMSTYLLQTLGYPALSEGNIIIIDQARLGVIDACSGLGMMMTFFSLATALVFVLNATRLDRILLVLSAVPIAVVANVIRITVTGMAYYATGSESVQTTMHDLAGWVMMPLALGMFWLELKFLAHLFVPREAQADRPLPILPRGSVGPAREIAAKKDAGQSASAMSP